MTAVAAAHSGLAGRRLRGLELSRRRGVAALASSLALHAGAAVLALLLPAMAARRAERPPTFVPVQIVPVQALGVPEPRPRTQPRREAETPPPQAEPQPPRREPEVVRPDARPRESPPAPAVEPREESGAEPEERQGSPTGSSLGVAPFGAAVAGLDNPDFTYDYYVTQMLSMIRAQWVRPPLGGQIEAVVHYRIGRDGTVRDVRIGRSSGYSAFDLAALRAVQAAAPFPPLPRGYARDSLGVSLIVR